MGDLSKKDAKMPTALVQKGRSLKQAIIDFSNNTTFHGVRYITASSSSIFRRLMWIMFVLACTTGLVIQIVDRVKYYYEWPINVNVKINYNQSLKFPSITLCNQNAFKATAAADRGWYRLIEDMFSKTNRISLNSLEGHNATNVSMEDVYASLAHNREDFFVNCVWNKYQCKASDFEVIFTDHGVCFKFKENETEMKISSSGVEAGLRLTLNVEQYEYMTGPHDSAGVKILLHDPREIPSVHGLGQAIPTGTHAFVGVKFMMIDNLPTPHGDCDYKDLRHTTFYTTDGCYTECLVDMAAARCGCRDIYMPHTNGYPPVCTLEQNYGCLENLKEEFNEKLRATCKCPVPCNFALFDPSVSYATISNHIGAKLISPNDTIRLTEKLLRASEITAKMDNDKFSHFKQISEELLHAYKENKDAINGIRQTLEIQKNQTESTLLDIKHAYLEKERLYRFQQYAITKNFLRGREAMEERTLRNVVNAYAEFAMLNARRIRRLAEINETFPAKRDDLYEIIIDSLTVRKQITELARQNITLLIDSFINGTRIFNYKFEDIDRSHNNAIVPKPLLNYSMHHNWYVRKYVPKLRDRDFDLYEKVFNWFMGNATQAYFNYTINDTELNYVFERYQYTCRTFMFSKSVVYQQGIDLPLRTLEERHADFDDTWEDFNTIWISMEQTIKALEKSLLDINDNITDKIDSLMEYLQAYIASDGETLMELADEFLSEKSEIVLRKLEDFFREVRTRGQSLNDKWSLLEKPTSKLWEMIIDDENMLDYYEFTNNSLFLRNLSDVQMEWTSSYERNRNADMRKHIKHADERFFTSLETVTTHLRNFRDSIKIDSTFLRQNFLQLDIFFRQLSYEEINQQKAYDFFALICDIGGSMGLFIGASMLTIVEIIDLFLTQTPLFSERSDKKKYIA